MNDAKESATVGAEGVFKSEDPGESLEEAGLSEEGDDGVEAKADTEVGETGSDEAGDEDPNAGGEGEEVDRDRGEDAQEDQPAKGPTEVDAIRALLEKSNAELAKLRESAVKPQEQAAPAPQMTEEQWSKIEERFGGLSRGQIEPMALFVDKNIKSSLSPILEKFARIEKELLINEMAESEGTRDIKSHRKEIDGYLSKFSTSEHSDPEVLKMALIYARGLRATESSKKRPNDKERGMRVVGAGKPNTGGGSAGGTSASVKLSEIERSFAKAHGMSEREYHDLKVGKRGK